MDRPLRIYLFGGFMLELGGDPVPPIPSRVGRSLFAYLVANAGRAHTRELLAGIFWPEHSESRARRRLSHTLWQLQSVLAEVSGETFVIVTPNTVQFNTDSHYWLDVEEFERSLSPAQGTGRSQQRKLERAVSLYRGDFLAGFYDDWTLVEQEQRREEYFSALSRLVKVCKSLGEYEEGLVYARRLTVADHLREDAHRDVMRLCSLLDRFSEAVQQYDRCSAILNEELGSEPSQETQDLLVAILTLREKGERPFAIQAHGQLYDDEDAPLVGRVTERASLIERLEEAFAGRGGVVLIDGEPGIGKTRLLKELANDANWRGVSVLWGTCPENSMLPYEAVRQALAAGLSALRAEQLSEIVEGVWLREVSRIVPELAGWLPGLPETVPLRAGEGAGRMREAVTRVITALGQINESLIVIDDVQWADDDTLQMLVPLAERLRDSRVLLCLTYRSSEIREKPEMWKVVRNLDALGATDRMLLGPLSAEETGELVRRSTGATTHPPELVGGLFSETGGNPFFLLETLRALFEQQARFGESTSLIELLGEMDAVTMDDRVADVVGRRIEELGPEAVAVFKAAAIHGGDPSIGDLARIGAVPRSQVLDVLDAALTAKIMFEEDGRYHFWHQLFRRFVSQLVDPAEFPDLHFRAGVLVEEQHPDRIEEMAFHFSSAEAWSKAVPYLARAGERAVELHAYETAARHYVGAVDHAAETELSRRSEFDLLASFEKVLDVLGRRAEQEDAIERMLGLAEDATCLAEAQRRRAWLLAHTDRFDDAQSAARESLRYAEESGDAADRGAALTALGMALSWSGHVADAVPHLEAAVASYLDEPEEEAHTRASLGSVLTKLQRYGDAESQLDMAMKTYKDMGNRRGEAEALGALATVHTEQGETSVAEQSKRQALEVSREIGYRHGEALSLVNLGNTCRHQARIGEAMRHYRDSREVFASIGNSRGEAWALANAASLAHSYLGADEAAEADALAAFDYFEEIGHPQGLALCLDVVGGIARRRGELLAARQHYERALAAMDGMDPVWAEVSVRRALALLELEEARPDDALKHIDIADGIVAAGGLADAAIGMKAVRGLALLAAGDVHGAYAETAVAFSGLNRGIDQAYLLAYYHHQTAAAAGIESEAREAIEVAHAMLAESLDGLDADETRAAFESVPEHGAIRTAWGVYQPVVESARLPQIEAPTGRPLDPEEHVQVTWTVATYEDRQVTNRSDRRRTQLRRLVDEANAQGAAPRIEDLAAALQVSVATVRRDLAALRRAGAPIRTRGTRRPAT